MTLEQHIEAAIREEATKIAERHQRYHNYLQLAYKREQDRITSPPLKVVHCPVYWENDRKFNPFHVLKHSRPIARSITQKIREGTYVPNAPAQQEIPKHGGGVRTVMVYQIPDAAISNLFYRRLVAKNRHRFSSFSYAYRPDRNLQFAIQDIAIDFQYYSRLFVAEFDFSDFFGSIHHDFLRAQFDQNGFLVSSTERHIIDSFLAGRDKGVPQGTSLSLFLANLACWRLDKELESEGLKFARYADDTVIWSKDYGKICTGFEIIDNFSKISGVTLNVRKSEGISLLTAEGLGAEFQRSKRSLEFLGYSVSVDCVSIKRAAVNKIKKRISYLLYRNLLQPLMGNQLRAVTIPANDRDDGFVSAISQIRRYLYGNLSEDYLRAYLAGFHDRIAFKGLMSFYPLVDDIIQLQQLDGWMLATIYRCVRRRGRLLAHWGYNRDDQFPFNCPQADLLMACKRQRIYGRRLLEIPSLLRVYRAVQRGVTAEGIERMMNPGTNRYHYEEE